MKQPSQPEDFYAQSETQFIKPQVSPQLYRGLLWGLPSGAIVWTAVIIIIVCLIW